MACHKDLIGGDIHVVHAFTFADETARTGATGLVPTDVGKIAKQTDNDTYYVLVDDSPITWKEITNDTVSGEANTASNVGVGGVGVFKQKTGVDLEFKKINAGSDKVTVTDDTGNDEVDIDIDPTKIDHGVLTGLGDDDHTQYVLRNILTAKGDIFVRTASGIVRLPVGADGQRLEADSVDANGVKWVTPSGGNGANAIHVDYASDNHLFLKAKEDVYTIEGFIGFPGTDVVGTPTTIKLEITRKSGAAIDADIKIFDSTNSLIIVEKLNFVPAVDGVFETLDLGTLANLPSAYARWELQVRISVKGSGKESHIGSLVIY